MSEPALADLAPERQLRRLELAIVRRLDGLLHGEHLGLVPGHGSELAESREYQPGEDDVRNMDWNVTARTTVPHVRDHVADRELVTWALVDASASMDFGTAQLEKRDLAVAAVAAAGFLTERSGNRIGAQVVQGDGVRRFPPRTGRQPLLALLRSLMSTPRTPPGGGTGPSLGEAAESLSRSVTRRGLVVVVSDFLSGSGDLDTAEWERPLRRLAQRQQLLAVEVVDPRELELPEVGVITLEDPETGRRREVSTASRRLRARYATAAAEQRETLREALRRVGAAHLTLRTDRDWVRDIVRHVLTQRRLARGAAVRPAAQARPRGGGG